MRSVNCQGAFSKWGIPLFRIFEGIFLLCLLISLVNLFVSPSEYRRILPVYGAVVLLWTAVFCAVFFLCAYLFRRFSVLGRLFGVHWRLILGIVTACLFLFQLWYAKQTYTEIGWDCSTVVLSASPQGDPYYFLTYPNNILIGFLFRAANKAAEVFEISNVWAVCIGVNLLFLDAGIVFGALCCKKLLPLRGYYLAFGLLIAVVGLSPYLTVPYSDTMALPFPIAIFYFLLLYREQTTLGKRLVLALLLGMTTLAGYLMKPTVVLVWIAWGIWLLLQKHRRPEKRAVVRALCVILAFVLGLGMVQGAQKLAKQTVLGEYNREELFYENEIPMTHFFMMGLHDEGGLFGAYYGEDADTTRAIAGKREKMGYHLSVIRQRLADYGVFGFLKHLYQKYVWITTDGTFFYGGEGHFHRDIPKEETGLRGLLQNFTYCETPFYQQVYGQYLHALWAFLLLGNLWFAVSSFRRRGMGMEFVMQLSLFGLFLFLMLFEARSRYLFLYLPFFILLASQGLSQAAVWGKNGAACFRKSKWAKSEEIRINTVSLGQSGKRKRSN